MTYNTLKGVKNMDVLQEKTQDEIYGGFYEWLCGQACWLQDAAWRIYNQKKIDDPQINIYKKMCIDEGLGKTVSHNTLDIGSVMPLNQNTKISICELQDINGVNALSNKAKLSFEENGLTVVYGLNGAGKSGYMRIFKQVCNHSCAEPIQPNIFKKADGIEPTCKFTISENGSKTDFICHLNKNNETTPLRQCDVFDTRISTSYISQKNNVSYEPFVFGVLSQLADVANQVENAINIEINQIKSSMPKTPDELEQCEDVGWLKTISGKTVVPEKFLNWSEADENELKKFEELLNEEQINREIQWARKAQSNLETVYTELNQISSYLSADNKGIAKKLYEDYTAKQNKYKIAQALFNDTATEDDQLSINYKEWTDLWKIAKSYYENVLRLHTDNDFATENSICPLCHQTINGSVYKRFSSVNEYINGTCSQEYDIAKSKLTKHIEAIGKIKFTRATVKPMLEDWVPTELVEKIGDVYDTLLLFKNIDDVEKFYKLFLDISITEAVDILKNILENKKLSVQKLIETQNTEEQQKIKKQLLSKKCHKFIHKNLCSIEKEIESKKREDILTKAKKFVKTNKITVESNILANELITEAYINRFSRELSILANKVKVKIVKGHSIRGRTPYQVVLATETETKSRTTDILSEGEQRIVSLAAFFADATGRNELTPIIIDDPISSLDQIYEQKTVDRIVELARDRQVIVFTHRISFLVGLSDKCKESNVKCEQRYIKSSINGNGVLDYEDIYHGNIKKQLNPLKDKLQSNKKKDPDSDEYRYCLNSTCQQFRVCVEHAIEEVLLMGIVKRFSKRIMTMGKLEKLKNISEDDCKIIDAMMTKYSFKEHSQSSDGAIYEFDIDDVINDISSFIEWIDLYNKKNTSNQ